MGYLLRIMLSFIFFQSLGVSVAQSGVFIAQFDECGFR
ncbi:hypothetical protein VIBRN418_15468 [Vibrio sp. N418]|nr:hypothetical protein VIBRN418_15468 [Vibrio sp. N418]